MITLIKNLNSLIVKDARTEVLISLKGYPVTALTNRKIDNKLSDLKDMNIILPLNTI